jgi:hypothetical protein
VKVMRLALALTMSGHRKTQDLIGKVAYVTDDVKLPLHVTTTFTKLGIQMVRGIHLKRLPHICVTNNPGDPGNDIGFILRLCGGLLVRPEYFDGGQGPVVSYSPAIDIPREVWVSDRFRASNSELFGVLQSLAFKSDASKWVCLDTPELYELAKKRAKQSSHVLGLVTKPEIACLKGKLSKDLLKHIMDLGSLLRFVTRVNHSTCAIGWRVKADFA